MQHGRVWLIGGTQESGDLAAAIASEGLPCIVTVTTATARDLYPQVPTLEIRVGNLNPLQLDLFLQEQKISAILDASHPYALTISQEAIAAAKRLQIPYLRYERPIIHDTFNAAKVTYLESFEALLLGDYLQEKRVFLTIGYRFLSLFSLWQKKAQLYARILPSETALLGALAAGFTADRLIALRPPISVDLERALWRNWNISLVVTKASGKAGGEDIKRFVAAELGIPLIIITRPNITYPQQTSDLLTALDFCRKMLIAYY